MVTGVPGRSRRGDGREEIGEGKERGQGEVMGEARHRRDVLCTSVHF